MGVVCGCPALSVYNPKYGPAGLLCLLLPACRFLFLHLHIYFGYLLQFGGPFCCILKLNSIDYQPQATESKPSNKPSISATCRDIVALHTPI